MGVYLKHHSSLEGWTPAIEEGTYRVLGAQRAWDTAIVWACLLSLQDCLAHVRGAARLGLKQGPFSAEPGQGLVAKSM